MFWNDELNDTKRFHLINTYPWEEKIFLQGTSYQVN